VLRFHNGPLDSLGKFEVGEQPVFDGHLYLFSRIAGLILSGTPENTFPWDAKQLDAV
jgi:hypothetical protein